LNLFNEKPSMVREEDMHKNLEIIVIEGLRGKIKEPS